MKIHESASKYCRTRLLKWIRINVIYVVGRECTSEREFLISIYSIMRPTTLPTPLDPRRNTFSPLKQFAVA